MTALVKFNEAYHALMVAKSIDEVKEIRDKVEALRLYLKQQGESLEMQNACAEIKLRAERRAGELLAEQRLNGGDRKSELHNERVKLSDIGISPIQSHRFQSIAFIPAEIFEARIIETKAKNFELTSAEMLKVAKELRREAERKQQLEAIETTQWPTGQYHVIALDPPWAYDNRADDLTHRAANPYPSMTVEQITAMDIPALALADCVLWLWTTNAFIEEAHRLARVWGFEKKTILTWVKDRMGTGDWLRGQTEHCLMCVRGKPLVTLTNQTTVIYGPMREHSRKPDSFYELVGSLCPGRRVELFAREQREGWEVYGNETNRFLQ